MDPARLRLAVTVGAVAATAAAGVAIGLDPLPHDPAPALAPSPVLAPATGPAASVAPAFTEPVTQSASS